MYYSHATELSQLPFAQANFKNFSGASGIRGTWGNLRHAQVRDTCEFTRVYTDAIPVPATCTFDLLPKSQWRTSTHLAVRLHRPWNLTPKSKTRVGVTTPLHEPPSVGRKKWRSWLERRQSLIVIDWQDVERLLCLHVPGDTVEYHDLRATPPPLGHLASARFTLGRFCAYWMCNTFFFPLLSCPQRARHPVSRRVPEDIVLKQKSVPREL